MFNAGAQSVPLGGWTVSRPVYKRLVQTTAPAGEVISLAVAKSHLRVTHSMEDAYILTLISSAVESAELYMNRKLLPRTMTMWMDYVPGMGQDYWNSNSAQAPIYYAATGAFRFFELIGTPVSAVASVKYIPDGGTEQTVPSTDYIADCTDPDAPARIILKRGSTWPTDLQIAHSLSVAYTQGYADAAAIPASIKHGVLLLLAALWSNRGDNQDATPDVLQFSGVKAIFDPYRVRRIGTL